MKIKKDEEWASLLLFVGFLVFLLIFGVFIYHYCYAWIEDRHQHRKIAERQSKKVQNPKII